MGCLEDHVLLGLQDQSLYPDVTFQLYNANGDDKLTCKGPYSITDEVTTIGVLCKAQPKLLLPVHHGTCSQSD